MKTLLFLLMAAQPLTAGDSDVQAAADPYLWLEETYGDKALNWVMARNEETLTELEADPRYKVFYDKALEANNDKGRIAYVGIQGDQAYNFWRDAEHLKGLWRRAPLAEYLKKEPSWEILLDLDKLSKKEKENWVFRSAVCLPPENRLCIVKLSRGGKDAAVRREFDTRKKAFVKNGFELPEYSGGISWLDENTMLLADAAGPETDTESRYPRIVRKWARGTDPWSAPILLEGEKKDVELGGSCYFWPAGKACLLYRATSTYEGEQFLLSGDSLKKMPLPADAETRGVFGGKLLLTLHSDWKLPGHTFRQNSLVAVAFEKAGLPEEQADPELVFEPGPRMTVSYVNTSKSAVLLSILDNVNGRLLKLKPENGAWKSEELPVPPAGTAYILSSDNFRDNFMFSYKSFLAPEALFYSESPDRAVKRMPAQFDASGLETAQREAVSKDGTKIPYFLVYPKGMKYDGTNPTLLTGYGGFNISQAPYYSPSIGRLWLEQGGVHVVANIRGGGEFGPAWHKAGMLEKRQNAFDDFIAVAEDLVRTGVTSPAHLGIKGGSNGGLLMGVMFTQRPDLFKAVLCEVPLLDMLRYPKLTHGPQWAGEYGDPDSPEFGPVLAKYSPYQNIRAGVKYPDIFFLTSTMDDRVYPGHARKTAAKLMSFGNKVYYYENIDGGHNSETNKRESARTAALEYVLLSRKLKD